MEYREIVSVTGLSGLYQLLSTKSDGAIVRSLEDKSTKFISARVHNVTLLESIEIYTTSANVRLHEVLEAIKEKENEHPLIDPKKADNHDIKGYMKSVFPELDEDRVYVSDMKKIIRWYELLKANDLLNFDSYKQEETNEEPAEEVKTTAKKSTKAKEEKTDAEEAKKPVKKATKKKAAAKTETADKETAPKKSAAKKEQKK